MKAHQNKQHQQNKQEKPPPNYNMLFHNRPNIKKKIVQHEIYDHIDIQKNKCSDRIQERMRNKERGKHL